MTVDINSLYAYLVGHCKVSLHLLETLQLNCL